LQLYSSPSGFLSGRWGVPSLSAALGLSCRRITTADNERDDDDRAKFLASLSAALGLSRRRLAAAGNERDDNGRVKFLASVHN
jgi:hypothetical protein